MCDVQTCNGRFYLRDGGIEIAEVRDEVHARRYAATDELIAMIERLIPLVPETISMMGSSPLPAVREARALIGRLS